MAKSDARLILGYYPERTTAGAALKTLRKNHIWRAALLAKAANGRLHIEENALSQRSAALFGGVAGFVAGRLLPLPRVSQAVSAGVGAAAGYLLSRNLNLGIADEILAKYAGWLMRGESAIVAEVDGEDVSGVVALLRESKSGQPTIFVVRVDSGRELPAADPLRSEVYTIERLREHAGRVAEGHARRAMQGRRDSLLERLRENERILARVNRNLNEAVRLEQPVSIAAEWLLDNAYIVEGQIADVRQNLSKKFYSELPLLSNEGAAGIPRVYAIACELIGHVDARLDAANIGEFITAYQNVIDLTMGELWALPLALRLALIENLRRLAAQVDKRQRERERADFWANRLLNAAQHEPDMLLSLLADLAEEQLQLKPHFADRLISHLYDEETALIPVQSWLERKLDAPLTEIMQREQQRQAADQVTVANTITSLRFLMQIDWRECFETYSHVEHILRDDPASVYAAMDFETRDMYRHEIERIARGSPAAEPAVARRTIELTSKFEDANGKDETETEPSAHVGYYLIGNGQRELETQLAYQPKLGRRWWRFAQEHPHEIYFGGLAACTGFCLHALLHIARRGGAGTPLSFLMAALLPASEIGVQAVNYLSTRLLPPRRLPKMCFEDGLPDEYRSFVVVPMLLLSADNVQEELERLEVHFLANPDKNLRFALLSDFRDADSARTAEDDRLLQIAIDGIKELNQRHRTMVARGDIGEIVVEPFFLFHRDRIWSHSEQRWMGWERKRGKLEQLNRYLCGEKPARPDQLHLVSGREELLDGIRFVITLDADTQLPRDEARRLVETLAHPLNRPRLGGSEADGKPLVRQGYGVIQPRVSTSLPSATATRFSRLFTDPRGSDPYTHVVSDVYQDLFHESSYHGKGIYNVAAFDSALSGRFPDATLLSHDLLEGAHVRVGAASDIELYDQFPPTYVAYCKRMHRWIRGDWQISPWVLPRVPAHDGGWAPNPLSRLNRWKIADNLRRSLVTPASIAVLGIGWLHSPGVAWAATVAVTARLVFPPLSRTVTFVSSPWGTALFNKNEFRHELARAVAEASFLPHQAVLALDAIARVFYRRFVSHRQYLEWEPASLTFKKARARERDFLLRLGGSGLFAAALGALILAFNPAGLAAAAPLLGSWMIAAPLAAWLAQAKKKPVEQAISEEDCRLLRQVARQTWRYFDDFVGPQTNWLPPDNYQESLRVEIAQRTSPTNIGLWLNAILAARDFGYLPCDEVIGRALQTMTTLGELEQYGGHLLNWYDVQSLQPLRPRYVSAVDSGNLIASLWTMVQGCADMLEEPLLSACAIEGLQDTLWLLRDEIDENDATRPLVEIIARLDVLLAEPVMQPVDVSQRLRAAVPLAAELAAALSVHQIHFKPGPRESTDLQVPTADPRIVTAGPSYWAAHIYQQLDLWLHCVNRYLQWLELLADVTDDFLLPLGSVAVELRRELLAEMPSLHQLGRGKIPQLQRLLALRDEALNLPEDMAQWLHRLEEAFSRSQWLAGEMLAHTEELIDRMRKMSDETDMRFLYNPDRKLFSIGFNVDEMRLDSSYYDLLASECRLASLVAIARSQVPAEHWMTLGRRFSITNGRPLLLSWSGTMFEYLMPLLFVENFENSLLDLACKNAVARQIEYGNQLGIPWGISESAFSALDVHRIYQYKAFGVPGLGLKRGLEVDKVIAPYATVLALLVDPRSAIDNLKRLDAMGARGEYGFYDAIDFARQRITEEGEEKPVAKQGALVRTYMVHHQGMSFLALDNLLHRGIMQQRFEEDPFVRAVLPLLYESVPSAPPTLDEALPERQQRPLKVDTEIQGSSLDQFASADTPTPRVHLFSNGNYALMITNSGGGYSRWRDLDITRWRADTTRDNWGSWIYVRDAESNVNWSTAHHPLRRSARFSNITFKAERAEFRRRDAEIETITEVAVSPEDDAEIRRVTLINRSPRARNIELTSYLELVMAPHNADVAHPAFSKLFIETEALAERGALLAKRRPRSPNDPAIWVGHLTASAYPSTEFEFETDRAHFIGRSRSTENPAALEGWLTNSAGAVLDPIFSIRRQVALEPGQRVEVAFVTLAADNRESLLRLMEKYADPASSQRAFDMAWTHAQLEMHHLRIQAADGQRFQHLASHMLYPSVATRAPARRLRQNRFGQDHLWAYGISGDLPIMVVTIDNVRDLGLVRQALLAHTFWRVRGFKADLVILNEQSQGYEQALGDQVKTLIQAHSHYTGIDQPGGVFLRAADIIPKEDRVLLLEAARVVLVAARGTLAQQLAMSSESKWQVPGRLVLTQRPSEEPSAQLPFMELPYFNGLGGFTTDGCEYAIYLAPHRTTPAPWINAIANPQFGTLVSESGNGFSWFGNSQANRLSPWSNDPVCDPPADIIYVRDEDSGTFWSVTPQPVRELDAYRTRHGQGCTIVEHNSHAIEQELVTFVPVDDNGGLPVRVQRLRLRNSSSRRRRLRVTSYIDWTLGTNREETQMHVVTSWDAEQRILLARNAYNPNFSERIAFLSSEPTPRSFSADRTMFIGRNGSFANPIAMRQRYLPEHCGPGLDPCGTVQVLVDIEQGSETEVIFILGEAGSVEEIRDLVQRFRDPAQVQAALQQTRDWWDNFLGGLQVEVPDLSATFLLNRWLLYQTLSCRIWGRSAFYQSGGAFGFRDQLQDVMAMLYAKPELAREQILRAAAHQFVEGDVQHWWHPPADAGVRTRFADDLLWLPYVTAQYVRVTGDYAVLDEEVPFIETRPLEPHEHEVYLEPTVSQEQASIFEHCRRAIEKGSTIGPHGLPLIGTGDWNDGLNRVGGEGRGESVWMAWFLIDVLHRFAEVAEQRASKIANAADLARTWRARADAYAAATEANAWDGEWYRRAYFDDGTLLGSKENSEAQIDSLPQSWGILSGAAQPERAQQGMEAVDKYLVRSDEEMILLFTPPFDAMTHDPGYIKGYLPGVRENGGQYTHAAVWVAMAYARQGDGDKAVQLLRMLNPVEHARDEQSVQRYKVEPYVVAADVYALPGRVGQGGWTWYTGSSSWLYRAWIEEVLGFQLRGDRLTINPTLPHDWRECKIHYRYRSSMYHIIIENPEGVNRGVVKIMTDGIRLIGSVIGLWDDGAEHEVRVILGSQKGAASLNDATPARTEEPPKTDDTAATASEVNAD